MKKIVLLVLLAAGCLIAYNVVTRGSFSLVPSGASDEERVVLRLEEEFDAACAQYRQAGRTAGLAGVDTTSDAEAARLEVARLGRTLRDLEPRLADDAARERARRLARRIREFEGS